MVRFIFILLIVSPSIILKAQSRSLVVEKAIDKIELDGILNEQSWEKAEVANNFYQQYPVDSGFSISSSYF